MNIAILDDSKEDLRQVKSVISSYYESQNTSADIHLYSSAEAFFTKYIPGFYDLIIMDIYMGSMTGMDAARKLREARVWKLRAGSEDSPITASLFLSLPAVISLWKAMMYRHPTIC